MIDRHSAGLLPDKPHSAYRTPGGGILYEEMVTLHPAGIAHGPHPGAYEASVGTRRTEELAVMCDTFAPLSPTPQAANIEDRGYHETWLARERVP
jgi:homogentisate 1,2-dioxygenase